jgi:hypothetical protein
MRFSKILLIAGLGLCSVAFTAQDSVTLQRTLTENSTETYKIDSKADQTVTSPMGEMPLKVTAEMTYQLKTGKVDQDKGTADVDVTITVDKVDSDGPMGQMLNQQQIKPVLQKGTIDKRGHLALTLSNPGDTLQLAMSGVQSTQSTLFIEFPDHPIKVGDSWDITVPKSPFTGPDDQTVTAKLTGDKKVDGKDVWVVGVSGKLKMSFDTSKLPASSNDSSNPLGAMKILVKGSLDLTGEGLVDKASGKTVSMKTTGNMKSSIEIPDHDITMDSTGTMESTVKLQG